MADNIVHRINPMPLTVVVTDPAAPAVGAPIRFGSLTGIALLAEGQGGAGATETVCDFGWYVATHPVTDVVAGIAIGDTVYYDDGADRLENDTTGTPYGIALGVVGAGLTASINVLHCPAPAVGAGLVNTAALANGVLSADASGRAKMAASFLRGDKVATGLLKKAVVAGQDETMDNTIPVTGLGVGDELVSVTVWAAGVPTDKTLADLSVIAGNVQVDANAANNAANKYEVLWVDHTP